MKTGVKLFRLCKHTDTGIYEQTTYKLIISGMIADIKHADGMQMLINLVPSKSLTLGLSEAYYYL